MCGEGVGLMGVNDDVARQKKEVRSCLKYRKPFINALYPTTQSFYMYNRTQMFHVQELFFHLKRKNTAKTALLTLHTQVNATVH